MRARLLTRHSNKQGSFKCGIGQAQPSRRHALHLGMLVNWGLTATCQQAAACQQAYVVQHARATRWRARSTVDCQPHALKPRIILHAHSHVSCLKVHIYNRHKEPSSSSAMFLAVNDRVL